MKPELNEAINELARNDAVVHAAIRSCRHEGLSEVDMLARLVINLAANKKALEAKLFELVSLTPPSTIAQQVASAPAGETPP